MVPDEESEPSESQEDAQGDAQRPSVVPEPTPLAEMSSDAPTSEEDEKLATWWRLVRRSQGVPDNIISDQIAFVGDEVGRRIGVALAAAGAKGRLGLQELLAGRTGNLGSVAEGIARELGIEGDIARVSGMVADLRSFVAEHPIETGLVNMGEHCQVTVTAPTEEAATTLGQMAVQGRLAACAQVSGPVTSTYWWEGEVKEASEFVCTLKTTSDRLQSLVVALRAAHSYEVPEIVAAPISAGDPDYLAWIEAETRPIG